MKIKTYSLLALFCAAILTSCADGGEQGDFDVIEEDTVTSRKYSPDKEDIDIEREK